MQQSQGEEKVATQDSGAHTFLGTALASLQDGNSVDVAVVSFFWKAQKAKMKGN